MAPRPLLAFDRASARTIDADGRLFVELCNISKANVCGYLGQEIPNWAELRLDPNRIYKLYRDPGELAKAADTFCGIPLLIEHVPVTAEKPRQELVVGTVGTDCRFEQPYLKASISVWTAEAIRLIESEEQEQLSAAYRYTAIMTPGVSPEGLQYDGVMSNLQGNHVALVVRGRAGPDVVVADSDPFILEKTVKRSKFITALAAALGKPIDPAHQVALDAAMEDDEENEAYDAELTDEEKKQAKDAAMKELGKDSLTDVEEKAAYKKAAMDKRARDSAEPDKDDKKTAQDTAAVVQAAVDAALTADRTKQAALARARELVKPVCGAVTCDSADQVYAFALKQLGVALDGVPTVAYGPLFEALQKHQPKTTTIAQDAAKPADVSKAVAFLDNYRR